MLRAILVIAALYTAPALADDNWPQFRGPTGDGHATAKSLPAEFGDATHVTWKTAIHGRGWSSPVVWGDQVWMTTATEDGKQMYAVCVDRDSGKITHDIKLFDVESPREVHSLNSYASPTPAIEEGRVYIHFGSYGTAALNTESGETIWQRRDLPCDHHRGPGSSPMLFGELLIIHYDGFDVQYVVALNKQTGETVWKMDRNIDFGTTDGDVMKAYCTPIVIDVEGQLQLISPFSKAAMAYDPLTGKEIWRVRYNEFSATARPLFGHGLVFINTGFGKAELWAVKPDGAGDITDSHVVWKVTKSVGSMPSPLLVDDLIYILHDGGVASCVEATTGAEVWSKRLGGNYSASPIFADDKIYFTSREGVVTVIKPGREYEELATIEFPDGFMASPAAVGKSLFLRSTTHLYRIEE